MAGKTKAFGGDVLKLLFLGTAIADIAENDSTSPLTAFWVALHSADPTDTPAGGQGQNEVAYTGYARLAVARSGAAFSVTDDVLSLLVDLVFGKCTAGSTYATHISFGTAPTGAGKILYSGALPSAVAIVVNTRVVIEAGSTITEG